MEQIEELKPIPVEEQISNALVKENVTEAKIAELHEKYMPLTINGIEDKEGYLIVKEARKDCKGWRVLAEKLCKAGREDAVAIQKAWVAKEKDITGRIGKVEDYLEKQEKEYDAAVAKDKEERKRKQDEQLIIRQQVLTTMGALYADGKFVLGDVEFEMSLIKESEQDIWLESILPKFQAEYEKVETERIEQERIKQEQEAELKRQQEEVIRKEQELAKREAALKQAEEERLRKEREKHELELAESLRLQKDKESVRINQLVNLGLIFDFGDKYFKGYDCYVHTLDVMGYSDEKWEEMIKKIAPYIAEQKEEEEQKRLAEIEAQKEAERIKAVVEGRRNMLNLYGVTGIADELLAAYSDSDWDSAVATAQKSHEDEQYKKWEEEQEQQRVLDEMKKALELEQAKDKEKWEEVISRVNAIVVYEMRSSQYRKKAMILREKIEEIKAL